MKNRMKTIYDLIEEAKLRTVWWVLCIFGVTYFLSHTSKSMWMNLPLSVLLVCTLRILFNEVEFRKKDRTSKPQTYLSHLEGKQLSKQLSANYARNSTTSTPPKWKTKIDSPIVEAAICEFVDKLLNDFVIDLWLSVITPDREAAQHIRSIILDALGEVAARAKQLNLVDLLTKDIIDLIGNHLDLFRRNQAVIGVDVMKTLTSEERDEKLKHHLMVSKELHPALISTDSEYKFLQRLMDGVLATVLKPREAQCPVVQSIAREIVTCLVMQPVMSLANPGFTNEWIVTVLLAIHKEVSTGFGNILASNGPTLASNTGKNSSSKSNTSFGRASEISLANVHPETSSYQRKPKPADWARMLEVASQRRTEVLMPENLENMWAKGRNYKKKEKKYIQAGAGRLTKVSSLDSSFPEGSLRKARSMNRSAKNGEKGQILPSMSLQESIFDGLINDGKTSRTKLNSDSNRESLLGGGQVVSGLDDAKLGGAPYKGHLRRSLSGSDLKVQSNKAGTSVISDCYSPKFGRRCEGLPGKSGLDMITRKESQQIPKLRCRVIGAYYEKLGSKSFAVYSIAVMAGENRYWFVKRRYSNFERLHRHLKEIPNYTIHLPPKRIFSSSTEDAFVHQRCIQLDKYLRDLLSIANVAEQHEVWDFLSASSQNYSFAKSSSAMKTLAVTVDAAADDIVRQFRGVSDGLTGSIHSPRLFCSAAEEEKSMTRQTSTDSANNFSDEGSEKDLSYTQIDDSQPNGWHSDNELNSRCFPPRIIKHGKRHKKNDLEENKWSRQSGPPANLTIGSVLEDPIGIPPEWTPSKLTVPLLNLVDNVLQLKRRGWLRRQVFWMSLQMLQLVMEDAIDDWLLGQINWLRKHDVIAQGIQWIQDILWPGGKFFLKIGIPQVPNDDDDDERKPFPLMNQYGGAKFSEQGSFEQQLDAARRASDLKKLLFEGVPTALVGLIGAKQYKHCARDIFYFTQSTVCVKQLAYAILELILVSLFPELRKTILDVHEKEHLQQPVQ